MDIVFGYYFLNDFFIELIRRLAVFFEPSHGLFIGYLLSSLIIALLFYSFEFKAEKPFFVIKKIISSHRLMSRSTRDDVVFYFVDKVLFGFIYTAIIPISYLFKEYVHSALLFISFIQLDISLSFFLSLILTFGAIVVFDFAVFIEHLLSHKIRFLWEFHKIHHIAENLTPFTAYRTHPINQMTFIFIVSFFSGLYSGIVSYIFKNQDVFIVFAGQNIFMFILLMFGLNLQHSMVFLKYPQFIRSVLVSPAYHQLHHSSATKHHDINYAFIFSFWDKLFKTQIMPGENEGLAFGVTGEKYSSYAGVLKMYITPFRRVAKRMRKKKRE
ncbi:sterol desaturase family protein [Erwiniaceae bacterium BAC15a-03b]|uniref:Sterol desaturase family protein n=1 Tax=Winslowiella arboricola TaxID=2978220 RepID=A0A9J6PPF6_9GAMM|nr:sterol desaturase family protein [Winslowiella arboricola]MCU5771756.1 sterol desaturase family protein [Winslowiella arboricola]MCU5777573.1 sterol desaturase family protein [Winslowiella arboricola]